MYNNTDLHEKKYNLLLRLKENTYSVEQLVEKGASDALIAEIRVRENLIRAIDDIDTQIVLLKTKCFHPNSAMEKTKERWTEPLAKLLDEIKSMHSKCIINAQTRAKELKEEIQNLRTSSKAIRGYSPPAKNPRPRFVDTSN